MAQDTLEIRRLRIDCEAVGAPAARVAQERLERIAGTLLPQALAALVGGVLPDDWRGEGVSVHIPRLVCDLEVDLDAAPDRIARAWAHQLALALVEARDATDIVRFGSPAERLAAFLSDLLSGIAWDRGIWREFDGLRHVGTSRALLGVLAADPDVGLAAVRQLPAGQRERLIGRLAPGDALDLLTAFAGGGSASAGDPVIEGFLTLATSHLASLGAASRGTPAAAGIAIMVCDDHATGFARKIGATRVLGCMGVLLAMRTNGDAADPDPGIGHPDPVWLPADETRRIAAAALRVQGRASPRPRLPAPVGDQDVWTRDTPFGGAFLLMPHLLELCPDIAPDPAAAILSSALGLGRAGTLLDDDACAAVFGDWPDGADLWTVVNRKRLADWSAKIGAGPDRWTPIPGTPVYLLAAGAAGYWIDLRTRPGGTSFGDTDPPDAIRHDWEALLHGTADPRAAQAAQIVLRRFAWCLPGFGGSSVAYLRENLLAMDATVTATPAGIDVQLGPAPLSVMLNLTGLSRRSYALPDGRVVRLSQRGAV